MDLGFLLSRDDDLRGLLSDIRTIAIVGLSPDPERPSHEVARYLQHMGYFIIPVNPREAELLGQKCYARLADIGAPPDMVDIFRRSEQAGLHVDEAIACGARAVWLQDGVIDAAAATRAHQAGLKVVMDRCVLRDHMSLGLGRRA